MSANHIIVILISVLLLCSVLNAQETGTITDIDGNVYQTVKIGKQLWMAENLRTTRYRNGDAIPTGFSNSEWGDADYGAYAIYPHTDVDGINSDEEMVNLFGKLYNWYAVDDSRGLCPTGWKVSSEEEWTALTIFLLGRDVGGKMKSTTGWNNPNTGATNESVFSALPGGNRDNDGNFNNIGNNGYWWSSTEHSTDLAWGRNLNYNNGNAITNYNNKRYGFSVRCLRDVQ